MYILALRSYPPKLGLDTSQIRGQLSELVERTGLQVAAVAERLAGLQRERAEVNEQASRLRRESGDIMSSKV
jgi:hypothetical protein